MNYLTSLIACATLTVSLMLPAPAAAQKQADTAEPRSQGDTEIREGADTRKNAGAPTDEDSRASSDDTTDVSRLDAPQAVREGNRLLRADELTSALRAYEHAQSIEPDAREIDFVQGLAHFKNAEYELARQSFEDAATASSDKLVDDALYGVGTTYHAEALKHQENPQEALPLLEQAMKRYQEVLAHQPDHQAAKDANYRAASKWRVIKKLLEEQQKQQQEQQEQDDQQKQDQEDEQQSQEQQQRDPSQQDEQEQDQQQDGDPQDEDQEPHASESDQPDENEQDAQQAQAQQEEVSREDAQRKLRELMQALRDRNEFKPKRAERYRPAPVDKDW